MRYLTEGMEPKKVLQYFEEICRIPHGSGNESALAAYIAGIAEAQGLQAETDRHGNVLVYLPASAGSEDAPPFLMQGHMDMVCEKESGCSLDMSTEPVRLCREGNVLRADGTTLGADNAVGLCNMLAVMTDRTLKHPPMEFLFTVREETGLEGIRLFDMSKLKSRRMLTMDCGDPDVLILGSAGMASFDLRMRLEEEAFPKEWSCRQLQVTDLHGGHTGLEIGNGYANALAMLTEILAELDRRFGVRLCSLIPGGGRGSIPDRGTAVLAVPEESLAGAQECVGRMTDDYLSEFSMTEPDMSWSYGPGEKPERMLTQRSSEALLDFLLFAPCGPLPRHPRRQRQVMGSALLKCAELKTGGFTGIYAIRANTDSYKRRLADKFIRLCRRCGVDYRLSGDDPAWPEKPNSALTAICLDVYRRRFGREPAQELVHGGEEASIVAYRIPEMEIAGIAPYSRGAHTPKEWLDLGTMLPVWEFLTDLLARLSEE